MAQSNGVAIDGAQQPRQDKKRKQTPAETSTKDRPGKRKQVSIDASAKDRPATHKQAPTEISAKDRPAKPKQAPSETPTKDRPAQKKVKFERHAASKNARTIVAQASSNAFKHGELDVDKFVKSREYEIRALEQGLVNSKKALSRRAFQLVPKELRRRTASHNAKRVPKKLRERAKREMNEDNTPLATARRRKVTSHHRLRTETAKRLRALGSKQRKESAQASHIKTRPAKIKHAGLADVPLPKARFRKRQRDKTWLPTHLFHAKRARMTPPKEPLWRFALPLTPTAKSYRPTHRAANDRGAVAFDMSYISTIMLSGCYYSLFGTLQALDADASLESLRTVQRWKWLRGESVASLPMYHRDPPHALIAPVTIIWCPSTEASTASSFEELESIKGSLFLRVHPSAFLELWAELLRMSKTVKPAITVEDLRYEVGCIEMVGPASLEALLVVLKPCSQADEAALLPLTGLCNTALLSAGTVIAMDVQDPRLCQKARQTKLPLQQSISQSAAAWAGSHDGALFDRHKRRLIGRRMLSQKAINRRRSEAAPGSDPTASDKDPHIPCLLHTAASTGNHTSMNKWTLLLPWKCVLPVWYSLIYVPLSTGMQPRFGGLTEDRDLSLEHGIPWFPADYPASQAGWKWEIQEQQRRKADWSKRPKSKRVNWARLDLGSGHRGEIGQGWACDWIKLCGKTAPVHAEDVAEDKKEPSMTPDPVLRHISAKACQTLDIPEELARSSLMQVRIEQISRGVAQQCARIYRLPASTDMRQQWLSLHPRRHNKTRADNKRLPKLPPDAAPHLAQQRLAQSLLEPPQAGQPDYPPCPGEDDLIGFVTSGNFDLGAGRGTAIASIVASAELKARADASISSMDDRLCIVRNSGQTIGRLAQWHLI